MVQGALGHIGKVSMLNIHELLGAMMGRGSGKKSRVCSTVGWALAGGQKRSDTHLKHFPATLRNSHELPLMSSFPFHE
jgi:hypothetical protein